MPNQKGNEFCPFLLVEEYSLAPKVYCVIVQVIFVTDLMKMWFILWHARHCNILH